MKQTDVAGNPETCDHEWESVSLQLDTKTQKTPSNTRGPARTNLKKARVWLACLKCASHTYMSTSFVNFRMYGAEDRDPVKRQEHHMARKPVENPPGNKREGFADWSVD